MVNGVFLGFPVYLGEPGYIESFAALIGGVVRANQHPRILGVRVKVCLQRFHRYLGRVEFQLHQR